MVVYKRYKAGDPRLRKYVSTFSSSKTAYSPKEYQGDLRSEMLTPKEGTYFMVALGGGSKKPTPLAMVQVVRRRTDASDKVHVIMYAMKDDRGMLAYVHILNMVENFAMDKRFKRRAVTMLVFDSEQVSREMFRAREYRKLKYGGSNAAFGTTYLDGQRMNA